MQNFLDDIRIYNTRQARPRRGKCALLVIDMQKYFLPMALPVIGNVLAILNVCRLNGGQGEPLKIPAVDPISALHFPLSFLQIRNSPS